MKLRYRRRIRLEESASRFFQPRAWVFVRKAGQWVMKVSRDDAAGFKPKQNERLPRKLKKSNKAR